ncbi:G-type lectin S-receptor-like serine/threonine-protein kinase At1g11300 [Silene latifolia]|uniref:G-type lectin S-receptor-like serine/threonine-protein kinase At1g11300 n=1 Tax=Silene latifolia TaxID=37657 RepID=UPI003D77E149
MQPVCTFIVMLLFHLGSEFSSAVDSLTSAQLLKDPGTLVSNKKIFSFGFFSPPNSTNRYVGIWYNQPFTKEVIWVANKNNPLTDHSGVLKLSVTGNLQVLNGKNETLWSSNVTLPKARFSMARILDYGDLVVEVFESNTTRQNGTALWQSFQHPTDSVLPNMRFTLTKKSDLRNVLQSWTSPTDPSNGRFALGTNSFSLFQIIIWDGDSIYWRSGPWNGNIFIGTRYHNTGYGNIFINTGTFTQDDTGGVLSLVFTGANESFLSHYALSYQGIIAQRWWDGTKKSWSVSWNAPDNECDIYAKCGVFGSCNPKTSPICSCLKGFEPKDKEEWKRGNWTSGCVRRKPRDCTSEGFLRLGTMKVPDNAEWTVGLNKDQCRDKCVTNCTCLAYAYDTAIACMTWSVNLVDIAVLAPGGTDLFVRLAYSELGNNNRVKIIIIVSVILGLVILLATIIWFLWKWRAQKKSKELPKRNKRFENQQGRKKSISDQHVFGDKSQVMLEDLQVTKFEDVVKATNDFHEDNLLGRGGFGQVYKGTLEDGQEIAVKRLSRASGQGIEEFMNEVLVISKLQHRNLVKLLGCCVDGEEKMLIYEYMLNKSLDAYLFDSQKRKLLHWQKRFSITEGICRGLLYLHRDSRLRIIHRDLKPSNILLDENLNPKISDFGMARIFGGSQDQGSTQRVAGTYGYMSPEYAMEGHFSEKSDVFSFGVLFLEIISGKRNSSFWFQEESLSLIGYTWKLWNEDNMNSFIDPSICNPDLNEEIIRCIHVGLLCVQELAKDRPNISTVISMLVRDITDLPKPKPPGFMQRQTANDKGSSSVLTSENTSSMNDVTVTSITPR